MSWINSFPFLMEGRADTQYNNTLIIKNKESLQKMVENFDGLFDNIVNFTEEISNLFISPIKIPTINDKNDSKLYLNTARLTNRNVIVDLPVNGADSDHGFGASYYYYLGAYFYKAEDFRDYNGYTQIKIYLPYYGWVEVNPNECTNKYLNFRLMLDLYTGIGTYMVGVSDTICSPNDDGSANLSQDSNMRIIGTWNAQILIEIPLGSSNISDIKRNIALGAMATVATLASGYPIPAPQQDTGASLYVSGTSRVGAVTPYVAQQSALSTNVRGSAIDMNKLMSGMPTSTDKRKLEAVRGAMQTAVISADMIANTPCHGTADKCTSPFSYAMMSTYIHVVLIKSNYVDESSTYTELQGKPTGIDYSDLTSIKGYTEISTIRLTGEGFAQATANELSDIAQLLTGGVIFPQNE